jgi:hypothetical protein
MKNKIFGLILLTMGACFNMQAEESLLFTKSSIKSNELRADYSLTKLPMTHIEQELIQYVQLSVENAERGQSKLTPEILTIDGMSSPKIRHFLNNICSYPGASYLEIGCWKGSTFVSALYKNPLSIPLTEWTMHLLNLEMSQRNCFSIAKNF